MAGVRKSYSNLSLDELLVEKEKIQAEINLRIKRHQLIVHSFLAKAALQLCTEPKVKDLLQFIIYGNQASAEKLLIDNPEILRILLTQEVEVTDYSGRKIFGTALQLAMGAKDVHFRDDDECMVEMLTKYYQKLPDWEEVMATQIAEQFPEGFLLQEEERRKRDSEALHKVFNAIENAPNDDERNKALQDFID